MIRRVRTIMIFNEPSRLTITLKSVQGTFTGKELTIGNFNTEILIQLRDGDEFTKEIKDIFTLLGEKL